MLPWAVTRPFTETAEEAGMNISLSAGESSGTPLSDGKFIIRSVGRFSAMARKEIHELFEAESITEADLSERKKTRSNRSEIFNWKFINRRIPFQIWGVLRAILELRSICSCWSIQASRPNQVGRESVRQYSLTNQYSLSVKQMDFSIKSWRMPSSKPSHMKPNTFQIS